MGTFEIIIESLKIVFYKFIEFVFLLVVMFLSFLSLRTPYEQLEAELKEKKDKKLSDLNVFRRFFSFFFFGSPLIYFGLQLTQLKSLSINFSDCQTVVQLIIKCLSAFQQIDPIFYVLILIPFFIIIILKFQLEKVWYDLNKESVRLFNIRLIQFRDINMLKKAYAKAKNVHQKEFRQLSMKIIKSSRLLYTLYGIFLIFIVTSIFGNTVPIIVNYLIPLLVAWSGLCLILTIFEKPLSDFISDFWEMKESSRR